MSWRLVLKAVVILYLLTAVGTIAFGVASEFLLASFGARMRVIGVMGLLVLVLGLGSAIATFAWLARAGPDRPYAHAAVVVLIAYVTSYPVHVWIGTSVEQWAGSILALGLAALIGVPAGRRWRRRRDLADAAQPS